MSRHNPLTRMIRLQVPLAMFVIAMALFGAGTTPVVAQDVPTGMKSLTIGGGARAVGLGETMVADGSDPFVIEYNPAGLTAIGKFSAGFSHNEFFGDTRGEYISVNVPVGDWAWGGRAGYVGTDGIPFRTGPSEQPTAFFGASDGVFQGAIARRLNPQLSLGVSAGYVLSHIDNYTAQGAIIGVGMQYRRSPALAFGAAFSNLGPQIKFEERKFKMPNRFMLGGTWQRGYVSLRGEVVAPDNENVKWHFGTEVIPNSRLTLRAGLNLGYDTHIFSAGLGARTPDGRFGVDYAFAPYSDVFGTTHRFGLVISP